MADYKLPASQTGISEKGPQFVPEAPDPTKKFGAAIRFKFRQYPEDKLPDERLSAGLTNLEYVIAENESDLAGGLPFSISAAPEERAFLFVRSFVADLFDAGETESDGSPLIQVFQKHMLQSRMGTHCVFGLRRKGVEIEEHSFAVHVDRNKRVVMLCCTYLPDLPTSFAEDSNFPEEPVKKTLDEKDIKYESAKAEKQWLVIPQGENQGQQVVPGSQVKLRRPAGNDQSTPASLRQANLLRVTKEGIQKPYRSSSGAGGKVIGLGKILRGFFIETDEPQGVDALSDDRIQENLFQVVLRNLESGSGLSGRYAAVQDEINRFSENRLGVFTKESLSAFDRVNAYYYLDYIQRYFRENLDFELLADYPHLNPVQLILRFESSPLIAEYDVIGEKINFYKIKSTEMTAARDPRFIFHEFVHVVTDAIARLPRGGSASVTARAQETLQAQAMDEGLADYFACSLATQEGAQRASFYFVHDGQWKLERDLESDPADRFTIAELKAVDDSTWRKAKYRLGERWARCLWSLHKQVGPEVADLIIAHSIFFLTRWATLKQGIQAVRLADRLLLSGQHEAEIKKIEDQVDILLGEPPDREAASMLL